LPVRSNPAGFGPGEPRLASGQTVREAASVDNRHVDSPRLAPDEGERVPGSAAIARRRQLRYGAEACVCVQIIWFEIFFMILGGWGVACSLRLTEM
jgi:hypothetical protein